MQNVRGSDLPELLCRAPLHEECSQHHVHKRAPGMTPMTCDVIGERAQLILVLVRADGVENASHSQKLGITKVRP
jgi:hypothetical protein